MGKALIIKGLQVNNPIQIVTFKDAKSVLKNYYSLNSSISATEIKALDTFVNGLLDADIWKKISYFYPMLGDNLADMKIDAVSPDTEDLFTNATSLEGLSVENRILVSTSRSVSGGKSNRILSTDCSNFGIISSIEHGGINLCSPFMFMGAQGGNYTNGLHSMVAASTMRYPTLDTGNDGSAPTYVPSSSVDKDYRTYLDRTLFGDFDGNTARLYMENELFAEGALYPLTKISGVSKFIQGQAAGDKYKFLALTKHLTSEEWGIFYSLLNTFLVSVGKRK